jgi:glycosyltransferase involved in cell wall biosynthesis
VKIVIITAVIPKQKRGLGVVALNHAKALQEKGFEVDIFCRGEKLGSEVFEGITIKTFKYEKRSNSLLNYLSTSRNSQKAWKYFYKDTVIDVVHGHDYLIYNSILNILMKKTVKVFTVHDPLVYHQKMMKNSDLGLLKNAFFSWMEKNVYFKSDRIHYISRYTYNRFLFTDNRIETKSALIENWVDYSRFSLPKNKNEVRSSMGVNNEFVIFTVRALEGRMGLDRLIEAFNQLETQLDGNFKLMIGGKGPMKSELERLIAKRGLKNVELLGYLSDEDVVRWYQLADVVVVPSIDGEGFGLPIIEAMACGTPALGTPNCAIPEVLSDKRERLFKDDSVDSIYEGLAMYYNLWLNNNLSEPLEERNYVLERYDRAKILNKILETYTK